MTGVEALTTGTSRQYVMLRACGLYFCFHWHLGIDGPRTDTVTSITDERNNTTPGRHSIPFMPGCTPVASWHPVFFRHAHSPCYFLVRTAYSICSLLFPYRRVLLTCQPYVIPYLLPCQIDIHVIKSLPNTLGLPVLAMTCLGQ